MAQQTTYSDTPAVGFAGQLAAEDESFVRSFRNDETTDQPFGIGWSKGTTDDQSAKLPAAATALFIGVAVHTFARDNIGLAASGTTGIKAATEFNVIDRGIVYVVPEENVDPSKPVFMRIADGIADATKTQKGSFRASSDSGSAVLCKGCRWLTTATAGNPAQLYVSASTETAQGDAVELMFAQPSTAATAAQKLAKTHPTRHLLIEGVSYDNPTGLAASDTNYYVLALKQGATIIAQWSTKTTGGDGALPADSYIEFGLQAAANLLVPPGTTLTLAETLTGAATLPAGQLVIHGKYL